MPQVGVMYNLLEQIKNLENKYVTIGIHGDKGEQKKLVRTISATKNLKEVREMLESANVKVVGKLTRHRVDKNLTVAQIAAYNEFGNTKNPGKPPPQRSFLRSVLKEKKREINQLAQNALKKPEIFYDVIGSYILNEVNKKIVSGISPANSPYTIKRKGSSTPLVDTGQLKSALTYKVSNYD